MKIRIINAKESSTVGILDAGGRTKFKKIAFFAEAELDKGDDIIECRRSLAHYIEGYFEDKIAKK